MNKITRIDAPDFLKKNANKWNTHFANKRKADSKFEFQWKTYQKKKVNELLIPFLQKFTQNHCSFCDDFPFTMSRETIEHFRPKSLFPNLAYTWENLFLCCDTCQSAKLEDFDEKLLKPDEKDYRFEDYFQCNYKTGELEANETQSPENQEKAKITIKIYELNQEDRCKNRLRFLKYWENDADKIKDEFPYRYFLE